MMGSFQALFSSIERAVSRTVALWSVETVGTGVSKSEKLARAKLQSDI
jgi:hypothetical protein